MKKRNTEAASDPVAATKHDMLRRPRRRRRAVAPAIMLSLLLALVTLPLPGAPAHAQTPTTASLAIDDVSIAEGNAGTTAATFTITRSGATTGTSSVQWATVNRLALAGSDYVAVAATSVNFAAGETTKTVSVTVNGDTAVEADETFFVRLSTPTGATIADGSGTGTITNDDTAFAIDDVAMPEGNSGTKPATFTIARSGVTTASSSVQWATTNRSAAAGSDYVAVPLTTVTFAVGETTKNVSVTVNGDTAVEANETFFVNLSNPTGATVADDTGVGTLTNDDTGFAVNDVSLNEGNSGTTEATFAITRSGVTTGESSVQWATVNRTATAGTDFVAVPATRLTFAAGETAKSVSVTVNGDTLVEASETFFVRLSAPLGATIADDSGTGTITNDDTGFAINDVTVTEGNSGTKAATFTITRSGATSGSSSVQWATVNRSAVAGTDYVAVAPTTVTFDAGQTTKTVSVTVNGDTNVEANETFFVKLSNAVGALIADDTGTGTITNDDAGFYVNDVSVNEGNAGMVPCSFTVTRTGTLTGTASVQWATANGSAVAPGDYTAASGTLSFAAGEATKPLAISVVGDQALEPNETMNLRLSNATGGAIVDGTGVCTINSDDAALAINDVSVAEGDSGETTASFTITRSGATSGESSVQWATVNGSAVAPDDYVAGSGTVTFAANDTAPKQVTVTVKGDTALEGNESFVVNLSNATGATIADGSGAGTITNDDVGFAINDVSLSEGNSGTAAATFTITRSGATSGESSVQWATADGTANAGSDYVAVPATTLHFIAGETTKTVSVPVIGDTMTEDNETFFVKLSAPVAATIGDDSGTGTITNDDVGGPGKGSPWVVIVGDSYISGEAARWAGNTNGSHANVDALKGDAYYDAPTGTMETIPGCHRATEGGPADRHPLPGYIGAPFRTINLACSGAKTFTTVSDDGKFKPGLDFDPRGGQAAKLQEFALSHNVKVISLSIGGNDFDFPYIVRKCVEYWTFSWSAMPKLCSEDPEITDRVSPSKELVRASEIREAILNVRRAMLQANYTDSMYTIVVQDYVSPLAPSGLMRFQDSGSLDRQTTYGCGFWDRDADWINFNVQPTINGAIRRAFSEISWLPNVRFLEVTEAFEGHGLCDRRVNILEESGLGSYQSPGAVDALEWVNRIRSHQEIDLGGLPYFEQESLHPNYWGHLALRNCLRLAYNDGAPVNGRCKNSGGANAAGEPNMTHTIQISVPSVVGTLYGEASARISAVGLTARRSSIPTCEHFEPEVVIDQDPGPGSMVSPGGHVTLLVMRQDDNCSDTPL